MVATTLTRETLSPYIDSCVSRFPAVGERAVKAAEYVLQGRVQRAADQDGEDLWVVTGSDGRKYEVSIAGGYCQCPDAKHQAPKDHKGGSLCKHRIACVYLYKAGVSRPPTAAELITRLTEQAEEVIRLYVDEKHTGTMAKLQTDILAGYRVDDGAMIELSEPVDVSMDADDFWQAVADAGWQLDRKTRAYGGHVWWLEPVSTEVDIAVWQGQTAVSVATDWPVEETSDSLEGLWE